MGFGLGSLKRPKPKSKFGGCPSNWVSGNVIGILGPRGAGKSAISRAVLPCLAAPTQAGFGIVHLSPNYLDCPWDALARSKCKGG